MGCTEISWWDMGIENLALKFEYLFAYLLINFTRVVIVNFIYAHATRKTEDFSVHTYVENRILSQTLFLTVSPPTNMICANNGLFYKQVNF